MESKKLAKINLERNQLSDLSESLLKLSKLEFIDVSGNIISEKAYKLLKRLRKNGIKDLNTFLMRRSHL
ncbi:MAG: hypothetical protein ACOC44_10540 [Promethearchaeia archaeon]